MSNALARSWLFEIVDSKTEKIERSFTLIMPPTSYTIKEKGRVSVTKTFGNAFIDDYGPDNLEITLKGITGTAHVFPTFRTQGTSTLGYKLDVFREAINNQQAARGYNARSAFHVFRNDIMRYRDRENYEKKELRVYDLYDEQAFKCALLDFTVERNNNQPFRYPFTISLFVYERLDSKRLAQAEKVTISDDPFSIINTMDNLLGWYDTAVEAYQENIVNNVALFNQNLQLVSARLNTSLQKANRILESPLRLSRQLLNTGVSLAAAIRDNYNQGKLTFLQYTQLLEVAHSAWRESLRMYGFSIAEGAQQSKQELLPRDQGVEITGTETTRAFTFDTYSYSGVREYTVRAGDTLQRIAQRELGDEDLWPYIAAVNSDIDDNSDLVVGDDIYLPVEIEEFEKDTFIVTEDPARNPYGSDIRLDETGDIILQENNDVALIAGVDNVKQSVDMRMRTLAGSMLKQTAFGLSAQAGEAGTTMAIKYLRMSVTATILQDPRIESIDNLNIDFVKDRIKLSMDLSVVGRGDTLPVGVIL